MKRTTFVAGVLATVFVVLVTFVSAYRAFRPDFGPESAPSDTAPADQTASADPLAEGVAVAHPGFLYGRVTTLDGVTYEGRLRWGHDEEGFWGDYFNGAKNENPWAGRVPSDQLATKRRTLTLFGFDFAPWDPPVDLERPFVARFGDIVRIDAQVFNAAVTLKSGTVFNLDRMDANDFDDGLRVWDAARGVVDLEPGEIRTIEFLPTAQLAGAPMRLHGTVRTRLGDFTGFLQWNRRQCVGSDVLHGRGMDGDVGLRFDTLRSIARVSPTRALVTQIDGREYLLADTRDVGRGSLGIYVDDERYGRVLISWDAFGRLDFSPGDSGPAYDDFPAGHPLTGVVTTRAGRRLVGRLVYDLDESETTETLDAPFRGVTYMLPFGLVASIALPDPDRGARSAWVMLQSGESLELELAGDLGERNGGVLVFVNGDETPEYVSWSDVTQVEFDRSLRALLTEQEGGR